MQKYKVTAIRKYPLNEHINEYSGVYETKNIDGGIMKICMEYNLKKDEFHYSVLECKDIKTNFIRRIIQYIYNWFK